MERVSQNISLACCGARREKFRRQKRRGGIKKCQKCERIEGISDVAGGGGGGGGRDSLTYLRRRGGAKIKKGRGTDQGETRRRKRESPKGYVL